MLSVFVDARFTPPSIVSVLGSVAGLTHGAQWLAPGGHWPVESGGWRRHLVFTKCGTNLEKQLEKTDGQLLLLLGDSCPHLGHLFLRAPR